MTRDGSAPRPELEGNPQGRPLWLVLELTYRCPLQCSWCSNPLDFSGIADELTTEQWKRVLLEARRLGSLQLGFTGGEPLARHDLEELVAEADGLGFYTNLITSAMGLTPSRLAGLKEAGLKQVQVSLQSHARQLTDRLVGAPAHEAKIAAIRAVKAAGFPVVLNIPVVRQNIEHTAEILKLAEDLGVDYLEFANVQYYNWALVNRRELMPSLAQLQAAERLVGEARQRLGKRMTIYFVIPDYYNGRPKACMNGWGSTVMTIAPDGLVLPCQEARSLKGLDFPNARDHSLEWIWNHSPAFRQYRGDGWMPAPCRDCDERAKDFGGCRCQAFLLTGEASNTDPVCAKSPMRHLVDTAIAEAAAGEGEAAPLVIHTREASRQFTV